VRAADQFHVGIVVDDLDTALVDLSELFGYEWCPQLHIQTPVVLPTGELTLDLRFAYSASVPRLELIQSTPGTLWVPAPTSGVHHVGYWSDDVASDGDLLATRGYAVEATGVRPDGNAIWAYHRSPDGPRIELVSRELLAGLRQYWESGRA
jgi:hypothetical protein